MNSYKEAKKLDAIVKITKKDGLPPKIMVYNNNIRYKVLEAHSENGETPCSPGKVIASNLSVRQADEMLERLWAEDRVWWKEIDEKV